MGPRFERETIINFNEADETASVWTASESIYRRLLKLGYEPREDGERHAAFEMPKKDIKLPRPKRTRKVSPERAAALKQAHFGRKPKLITTPDGANGGDEGPG
jgi:hypothetical protein